MFYGEAKEKTRKSKFLAQSRSGKIYFSAWRIRERSMMLRRIETASSRSSSPLEQHPHPLSKQLLISRASSFSSSSENWGNINLLRSMAAASVVHSSRDKST